MDTESEHELSKYLYPSLTETSMETIWSEELCQQLERGFLEENREPCRELPKSADSRAVLPLYKYRMLDRRQPERTEEIINDSKLWSPSIRQLNDPLEAAVVFGDGSVDKWTVPAVTMFFQSQWCGCICFSYDSVCPQMWAHYADSHAGFVLKYERLDNWLLRSNQCQPVKYRRKIVVLDILKDANPPSHVLWTKSEAWEYEKEVRLQYPRTGSYTAPSLLKPCGIIFGLRTPKEDKDFLRGVSRHLRQGQIVFGDHPYQLRVHWND